MPTATRTAKPKAKSAAKPKPGANARTPAGPPVSAGVPATSGPDSGADVALASIRVCPFNLRRRFDDADIAGLAESIRADRLQQPLEVRPVGTDEAPVWDDKGRRWEGVDHFQLTDGERRLRALHYICEHYPEEAHACEKVQVIIRPLSDEKVRERMLVSREQSRPLSVSELVAGYVQVRAGLPDDKALAALVGAESVGQVRSVLRLAKLPPWVMPALDAGVLPRATAEVVARVPGEEARKVAAACVLQGVLNPEHLVGTPDRPNLTRDHLDPLSYRDAKDLIRNHFTVELKGAPFDRKALDLVPEAGSCEACPKRAGNDAEATAEGTRADVCLDPDCYRQKVAAHDARELKKGTVKGALPPPEEFAWPPYSETSPPRGWCDVKQPAGLSELAENFGGSKKREEVLLHLLGTADVSSAAVDVYAVLDHKHKLRLVAKTGELRKALRDNGTLKKPERPKGERPAARTEKAPAGAKGKDGKPVTVGEWEVDEKATKLAATVLREYTEDQCSALDEHEDAHEEGPIRGALELALRAYCYDAVMQHGEACSQLMEERFGDRVGKRSAIGERIDAALAGMKPSQMVGLMVELATTMELQFDGPTRTTGKALLAFAELDWDTLREQARRVLSGGESAEEKVAKAEAAKAADGPACVEVRRCRVCGCTDDNCAKCVAKIGMPCEWVNDEEDLCSACVPIAAFEGEYIGDLGVELADFEKARLPLEKLTDKLKEPVSVRPITLDGTPYVSTGGSMQYGHSGMDFAPLYQPTRFKEKFPDRTRSLKPQFKPTMTDEERANAYFGLRVRVGKQEYVLGPASEERKLTTKEPDRAAKPATDGVYTPLAAVPNFPAKAAAHLDTKFSPAPATVADIDDQLAHLRDKRGRENATVYDVLRDLGTPEDVVLKAGDALIDFRPEADRAAANGKPAGKKAAAKK